MVMGSHTGLPGGIFFVCSRTADRVTERPRSLEFYDTKGVFVVYRRHLRLENLYQVMGSVGDRTKGFGRDPSAEG